MQSVNTPSIRRARRPQVLLALITMAAIVTSMVTVQMRLRATPPTGIRPAQEAPGLVRGPDTVVDTGAYLSTLDELGWITLEKSATPIKIVDMDAYLATLDELGWITLEKAATPIEITDMDAYLATLDELGWITLEKSATPIEITDMDAYLAVLDELGWITLK